MATNRLSPQATAVFQARLDELVVRMLEDIAQIQQRYNSRGLLFSSGTVGEIYGRVDTAVREMAKIATDSAKAAYEAGHHHFTVDLERAFLDAFELNFSLGYERLRALRAESTQHIRNALVNKQMHENQSILDIAARSKIEEQLALRQYFQTIKRSRKKWHEHLLDLAKLILPFLKGR